MDAKKEMYANIILSGGTTLLEGVFVLCMCVREGGAGGREVTPTMMGMTHPVHSWYINSGNFICMRLGHTFGLFCVRFNCRLFTQALAIVCAKSWLR